MSAYPTMQWQGEDVAWLPTAAARWEISATVEPAQAADHLEFLLNTALSVTTCSGDRRSIELWPFPGS